MWSSLYVVYNVAYNPFPEKITLFLLRQSSHVDDNGDTFCFLHYFRLQRKSWGRNRKKERKAFLRYATYFAHGHYSTLDT